MIKRLIYSIFSRHHFWRIATFSEVAELYIARLLRMIALNMVTLFVALFLYEKGLALSLIALYLASIYAMKIGLAYVSSLIVARFGPKHSAMVANLLYIPAMVSFGFVGVDSFFGMAALFVAAFFQAFSTVLYDYSYLVNFSKVKNSEHSGKELGYMQMIENVARIFSPVIGGLVASLFSPVAVIVMATVLFTVAALPLLRTGEPIKTRQKIRFAGFPWRNTVPSMVGYTGAGFDVVASMVLWSLFLAVVVFADLGKQVYAMVGSLAALGNIIALIVALVVGRLIDRKSGQSLIFQGVLFKSLGHLMRPVVSGHLGVAVSGVASEIASILYSLAYTRGIFDLSDSSGFRLTYLLMIEISANLGAMLASLLAALLLWLFEPPKAFLIFFVAAAIYIWLIILPKFNIYRQINR